jgi:hypothetical protein
VKRKKTHLAFAHVQRTGEKMIDKQQKRKKERKKDKRKRACVTYKQKDCF